MVQITRQPSNNSTAARFSWVASNLYHFRYLSESNAIYDTFVWLRRSFRNHRRSSCINCPTHRLITWTACPLPHGPKFWLTPPLDFWINETQITRQPSSNSGRRVFSRWHPPSWSGSRKFLVFVVDEIVGWARGTRENSLSFLYTFCAVNPSRGWFFIFFETFWVHFRSSFSL